MTSETREVAQNIKCNSDELARGGAQSANRNTRDQADLLVSRELGKDPLVAEYLGSVEEVRKHDHQEGREDHSLLS